MPSVQPAGIAAFAQSFGDAFANGQAMNMRAQLAAKAQQDAMISDTLVKAFMDNPDLANDNDLMKLAMSKLGKENANVIAQTAMAFNRSSLGVMRKGFSGSLVAPDVPPVGPVFNPMAPDAQPEAIRAVVGPRLAGTSPMEMAFAAANPAEGVDSQAGFLQAKTQDQGVMTPAQAESLALRREQFDFAKQKEERRIQEFQQTFGLKEMDAQGRRTFRNWQTSKGERFDATIDGPDGVQIPVTKRRYSPDGGKTIVEEIVSEKKRPLIGAPQEKLAAISSALRLEDELERLYTQHGDAIKQAFMPFIGRPLSEAERAIGALKGPAAEFVTKLAELRLQRSNAAGGKTITSTELGAIESTLPTASTLFDQFPMMLKASREALTGMGVDVSNIAEGSGYIVPRFYVSASNRDYYKHARRNRPTLDKTPKVIMRFNDEAPTDASGAASGTVDPALDALWNQ